MQVETVGRAGLQSLRLFKPHIAKPLQPIAPPFRAGRGSRREEGERRKNPQKLGQAG
ncbi:hypothetical protein [Pyrobaculum neutrophilum]|uniref:hypothetical protein n=1 Tax=Pyrobaculum neutrophilum TaxID=70771 RepID=UPI00032291E8|nr:hypothetical protein [Pyrobaculum neutrophilum]